MSSAKVSNRATYDLSGKILIQHNTCQQIDVHSLAIGIYLILIKFQDGYLATEKFVINE
jgi:hypothetical protein